MPRPDEELRERVAEALRRSEVSISLHPERGWVMDMHDAADAVLPVFREWLLAEETVSEMDKVLAPILMDDDMPCIEDYRTALRALLPDPKEEG